MPIADRTTLNNLTPNMDIGDVADPALRLAVFQYLFNLSDANYTYLQSLVTSGTLSPLPPDFMGRQAIINGNFDVWQRGTAFLNPINGAYLADRFILGSSTDGGTLPANRTHFQVPQGGAISGSFYGKRLDVDGAGSGFGVNASYALIQRIENGTRFLCGLGNKVTISFYARSNISGKRLGISMSQRYGTGGSPSTAEILTGTVFTLSSEFVKYTYTFMTNTLSGKTFGTTNDDYLHISFLYMWGSNTATSLFGGGTAESFGGSGIVDIAQVQVCSGDVALPFQPRSYADELQLCQRYYEKSYSKGIYAGDVSSVPGESLFKPYSSSGNGFNAGLFKVTKRTTPTVTIYASRNGTSGTVFDVDAAATRAVSVLATSQKSVGWIDAGAALVSGNRLIWHWVADAEL